MAKCPECKKGFIAGGVDEVGIYEECLFCNKKFYKENNVKKKIVKQSSMKAFLQKRD